jgi:ribosomal 30S subunit maturation factor RimM
VGNSPFKGTKINMSDNLPLIYIKIKNLKKEIDDCVNNNTIEENSENIVKKINEIEELIQENLKEKNFWIAGISYKELITLLDKYKYIELIENQIIYLKENLVGVIQQLLSFENNPIVEVRIVNSYSDVIPDIKKIIHKINAHRANKYNLYDISKNSDEFIESYLDYIKNQFSSNLINVNDVLYIFKLNFFENLNDEYQINRNKKLFVDFLIKLFNIIKYNNIRVLQFLTDLFNFYSEFYSEIAKEKPLKKSINYLNFSNLYLNIVDEFIIEVFKIVEFSSIEFRVSFYEKIFRFYFKVNDYFKSFVLAIITAYYNYVLKDSYNVSLYFFRLCDIIYKFFFDFALNDNESSLDNNYRYFANLYFFFLNLAFNFYLQDPFNEELKIDLKFNFLVNNLFKNILFNKNYRYSIKNSDDLLNLVFNNEFKNYLINSELFLDFLKFNKFNEIDYRFYLVLNQVEDFYKLKSFIFDLYDNNKNKYSDIFLSIINVIFKEYFLNLN